MFVHVSCALQGFPGTGSSEKVARLSYLSPARSPFHTILWEPSTEEILCNERPTTRPGHHLVRSDSKSLLECLCFYKVCRCDKIFIVLAIQHIPLTSLFLTRSLALYVYVWELSVHLVISYIVRTLWWCVYYTNNLLSPATLYDKMWIISIICIVFRTCWTM